MELEGATVGAPVVLTVAVTLTPAGKVPAAGEPKIPHSHTLSDDGQASVEPQPVAGMTDDRAAANLPVPGRGCLAACISATASPLSANENTPGLYSNSWFRGLLPAGRVRYVTNDQAAGALPEVDVHERLRQGCLTNIPRMPPTFSSKDTE